MDHTQKLESLKNRLEKAKTARTRAEANLEQLEKQKVEIVAEMDKLGVTPETIEEAIGQLETEIQSLITNAEQLIPEGF